MHSAVTFIAKDFIVIPGLVLMYVFWRSSNADRKKLILTAVVSGIITAVLVKLGTTVYHDPRPFVSDGVTPYFQSSIDNGFPSDHTVLSTLLAWLVFGRNRVYGIGLLLIALLIGTSRVIAGVHHGKDIIGGFMLATIGYWLGVFLISFAVQLRAKHKSTKA